MPSFGPVSMSRLNTCHELLRDVFVEAIKDTPVDFAIVCGHRSKQDQDAAFKNGTSKLKYPNSKHNKLPSEAVDFAPYVGGKIDWNNEHAYDVIAHHIKEKAKVLGVPVEWGYDLWKWDRPHIQLNLTSVKPPPTPVLKPTKGM